MLRKIAAALVLSLSAVPVAAEAPLKRLTLRHDLLGWEAVGRLDLGDGGYCTGALIAPDLVLTAAHCLVSADSGYARPENLTFRPGLSDGTALAESKATRFVIHPGYEAGSRDFEQSTRHDLGLVQLENPVPLSTAAPFEVASLAQDARNLAVVSYGRGRDDALSWDDACRVKGRARGLIAFDCDVTFGSSGAPVFHRSGNRAAIVSLVSRGGGEGDARIAFGMELPRAVAELKAALRRGEGPAAGQTAGQAKAGGGANVRGTGGAKFLRP